MSFPVLISKEDIQKRVKELGEQISKDFERDYIIEIQDLTDKYIKISDDIIVKKIEEISEV